MILPYDANPGPDGIFGKDKISGALQIPENHFGAILEDLPIWLRQDQELTRRGVC